MGNQVGILSCRYREEHPEIPDLDFWYGVGRQQDSWIEADKKAEMMIRENIDVCFDDRAFQIYKKCCEMNHPEKICLCNWSYVSSDVIMKMNI